MTETDSYALDRIRLWTWSGFYAPQRIEEMLEDILEGGEDEAALRRAIGDELARKRLAEREWPGVTDCDRLDAIFYRLHEDGICALHDAGYTMSDGYAEVSEVCAQAPAGHYHGYCFYHGQDVERAVDGAGLTIAFGDLQDRDAAGLEVGRAVAAALSAGGFDVVWDGSMKTRIDLPNLDWQRRGPPGSASPPAPEPDKAVGKKAGWRFWRR